MAGEPGKPGGEGGTPQDPPEPQDPGVGEGAQPCPRRAASTARSRAPRWMPPHAG